MKYHFVIETEGQTLAIESEETFDTTRSAIKAGEVVAADMGFDHPYRPNL